VVDDLLARGCRLAQPGEFTRLAFVSGKMELVQAEAVATLINARSERALEVASRHLSGETGRRINYLRDQILAIMAQLEVHVDFPQEDLPQENADGVIENLELLSGEMAKAAETGKYAHLLESGVRTLIVGEPNAGKSSLFNTLCGKNRVIVSDQPGTTRDYVSERLHLGSFEIELIDTAGLRSEASGIELTGMERTLKLIHRVDFFLLTMDATTQSPTLPDELLELIGPKNCILVENKIDLPEATKSKGFLPEIPCVQISALTGEGLDTLNLLWEDTLQNTVPCPAVDALIVNSRHAERLWFAHSALQKATDLLRNQTGVELALSEIRMATEALGEIVGDVDNEDMLDRLFQNFCIGK